MIVRNRVSSFVRPIGLAFSAAMLLLCAGHASAQSFTNSTAITITDCPNPCPASGQPASLYPSPITVSGVAGVVERVSVRFNGFSHAFPADVDFLLVSPSGRKTVIMSDFGAGSPGVSNINVTLDDYAARPIPSTVTGNTGVPFVTGTYRPANSGTTDLFPAPAPAAPYTYTLSAFNGDNPNGTWNLYILDDANLDGGSISGGWTITFDVRPPPPAAGDILISEFRTRGVGTTPPGSDGAADEFIELYNNTDSSITIIDSVPGADPTSASGAGWRISGAQGAAETTFLVLPQTLSTAGPLALPPRGYFLISTQPTTPSPAGNTYSLSTYPTGTGITASGSANVSINPASATIGFLPDDIGLAVFSTAGAVTAARLDSVGFSSVTSANHKEGTGLAPAAGIVSPSNHGWTRRLTAGVPQDTGDNAADFLLVDPTGDSIDGVAAVLGAPGPERGPTMTSFTTSGAPTHQPGATMPAARIDPLQPVTSAPNRVRDFTPVTNGANGTLKIRRTYTNNTGLPLLALRFRIVALSTRTGGTVPAGTADLRVLNSPAQTVTLTDTTTVSLVAMTLQTPAAQALGGGVNSSLAVPSITTTAPLANGASVSVEFNFGVETEGMYIIGIRGEGLLAQGIGGVNVLEDFSTAADLSITKTDGVLSVAAGGSTTYTIVASNAGPDPVVGATVSDTFPATLTCTYTCIGAGGGTCTAAGSGNISDTVNLPVGGGVIYTATCAVSAAASGTIANTATVSAGITDPNPGNNSATDTNTVSAEADLAITKTDGVAAVNAGGSTTYTIVASNAGPANVTGATVSDTFPATLTCTYTCAGAGGGTCTAAGSGNISDTVNLPVGSSVTYTATCAVSAAASGTIVNIATVSSGVTDPNPGNNSATDTNTVTAVPVTADLSITKTDGVATAVLSSPGSYTIVVTNTSGSTVSATVNDTVPAAFTVSGFTCVGGGGGTCPASGGPSQVIAAPITLPVGGTATFTVNGTYSVAGALTNTATVSVSAPATDPNPGNNSASDTTQVQAPGAPSVSGTKTVTASVPPSGPFPATYTIVLTNSGGGAQPDNPGDEFIDVLPIGFTPTSATSTSGTTVLTLAPDTVTFNGAIPAGGSVTITIAGTVDPTQVFGGILSNQGTIRYDADGNGTNEATVLTTDPTIAGVANPTLLVVRADSGPVAPIPTLGEIALLLLILTLGVMGAGAARSRRR